MNIANVIQYTVARLMNDATLTGLTAGKPQIYKLKSRSLIQIPGIYWSLVSANVLQNEFVVTVQWGIWANSADQLFQMEARLLALMHSDTIIDYAPGTLGAQMWSEWKNRHDVGNPADQGVHHSALVFEYRPIREDRYSAP